MKTYDTSIFSSIDNRDLSEHHIDHFMKTISKNDKLHLHPVIVTPKLEVLDGQHRIAAVSRLNKDGPRHAIYYNIDHEHKEEDVIMYNTVVKSWTNYDFLKYYCKKKHPQYLFMQSMMDKYNVHFNAIYDLISNLQPSLQKNSSLKFRKGNMFVPLEYTGKISEYYQIMKPFIDHYCCLVRQTNPKFHQSRLWSRSWQRAFWKLFKKMDSENFNQVLTLLAENASTWKNYHAPDDILTYILTLCGRKTTLKKEIQKIINSGRIVT